MASLGRCKHCGYFPVAQEAATCPKCGGPHPFLSNQITKRGWLQFLVLIVTVGLFVWVPTTYFKWAEEGRKRNLNEAHQAMMKGWSEIDSDLRSKTKKIHEAYDKSGDPFAWAASPEAKAMEDERKRRMAPYNAAFDQAQREYLKGGNH